MTQQTETPKLTATSRIYKRSDDPMASGAYTEILALPEGEARVWERETYYDKVAIKKSTGTLYMYGSDNKMYIVIDEWMPCDKSELPRDFMFSGIVWTHLQTTEKTEIDDIAGDPPNTDYAPFSESDMALLKSEPMDEYSAHANAKINGGVIYKFVGDIDAIRPVALAYGYKWSTPIAGVEQTVTTAWLNTRVLTTDTIVGVRPHYNYRTTDKPLVDVTAWEIVQMDEQIAKSVISSGGTGDWDYDTRGRGEYSKKDGSVRGHYDVDYQD